MTAKPSLRLLCSVSILTLSLSCKPFLEQKAAPKAVALQNTEVEDQGSIGFCWAYALTGLLESLALRNSGVSLNLSEEAIGYVRMGNEVIETVFKAKNMEDLIARIKRMSLEGFAMGQVANAQGLETLPGGGAIQKAPGGTQLVTSVGVWPESAFAYKFPSETIGEQALQALGLPEGAKVSAGKAATRAIKMRFLNVAKSSGIGKVKVMPGDTLAKAVLVSKTHIVGDETSFGFPEVPPDTFAFNNVTYTPMDFLRKVVGVDLAKFKTYLAWNPASLDYYLQLTKIYLAAKVPVPFAFQVNHGRKKGNIFSGGPAFDPKRDKWVGGHAVLLTDFVNKGSKPGALSPQSLCAELRKPGSEVDYLVFKNSWGKGNQKTESGVSTQSGDGFYQIQRSYLEEMLKKNLEGIKDLSNEQEVGQALLKRRPLTLKIVVPSTGSPWYAEATNARTELFSAFPDQCRGEIAKILADAERDLNSKVNKLHSISEQSETEGPRG